MSEWRAPLVDSHAHLDAAEFADDVGEVIRRAEQAGVIAILTVGVDVESSRRAVALADRFPMIIAAVGIHPHHANECDASAIDQLRALARSGSVVAIGEIGLDYYRQFTSREAQSDAFRAQLKLGRELELPVIIHDRDAHHDVVRHIEDVRSTGQISGVMHCFSGNADLVAVIDQLGFHLSIAGSVTYPTATAAGEVVRVIPPERLLVETDCPYLAPQPVRGRRNEPAYVRFTLDRLAALRGECPFKLAEQTTANAIRLFGLRLPAPRLDHAD